MAEPENPADVTALTVQLLSAYLTNNTVASENLADLIRTTREALAQDAAASAPAEEPEVHTPAVSVRKSISSPEYLISLIDGKRYKTLKRHLAANGLTPETYRERYKLPANYPMVAPDFAAKRRAIAEQIGLGNRPKTASAVGNAEPVAAPLAGASTEPAAESKPSAAEIPAVKPPIARKGAPKSPEPAGKAKRKAATKPVKAKDNTPVSAAAEGDKVASAEPVAPEVKGKPKRSRTSASVVAADPRKKRAKKDATADVAPTPIAEAIPAGAPAPAPTPVRKPRGKLGLFGKGQATPGDGDPASEGQIPSEPAQAANPTKAPRAKRMARAPKATTKDAG
ncbi:MucR family transcriptional regulator (plasmid) [Novosphingobium resinovorum]|uniref:MucR family transcriptional regulator n=1 Tax=Novosphingobium TaxID=165696 RepID=UPI001B3C76E2|nr:MULTISPECIES: MucR family transcriptional regulator [Novosphingobium]MBF7015217.1 MucR family transcriptional regulator [Novosphingobium sp. HR1a]WJM29896.1 MucR family transcriptional regulator [Novosphingobium resinovorum]